MGALTRVLPVLVLTLAFEPIIAESNPSANNVVDLGKISITIDGVSSFFNVISADWMQRFGRISETAVSMRGGGRFYLATKPPTNSSWEPGASCACIIRNVI